MGNSNNVKERIKKRVLKEYQKYDTELNGNFFDFSAPGATFRNALDAYREVYAEVNGDDIEFVSNIDLTYQSIIIYGVIVPYEKCADLFNNSLIPDGMTIIEAIVEIEKFCKIYRIFDMKAYENEEGDTIIVDGEVLSFVW